MEWIGYFMATLIGVSLGLIGAGGSVLAVPVLAYLFGQDEKMATAYSLFLPSWAYLLQGIFYCRPCQTFSYKLATGH